MVSVRWSVWGLASCGSEAARPEAQSNGASPGKADVYGEDDRLERYQLEEGDVRQVFARASAAVVKNSDITRTEQGWTHSSGTLGEVYGFCDGELFTEQPLLAWCSATLVADDLVLTSGHCLAAEHQTEQHPEVRSACRDHSFIFDLAYLTPDDDVALSRLPARNVYGCAEIVAFEFRGDFDYALVRLDRPVIGRDPVPVRAGGPMRPGAAVVQIGHPIHLPQKIADGAVIDRQCWLEDGFNYDADILGGNSGGGVFDLETGALAGIPTFNSGQDYVWDSDRSCNVVGVCGVNADCAYAPGAFDTSTLLGHLEPELAQRLRIIDAGPTGIDAPACAGDMDTDTDGWGTTSDTDFDGGSSGSSTSTG